MISRAVLAAIALLLVSSICAVAQTTPAEDQDIQTALAAISGADPIQRVLATQTALHSDNQLLRSLALEKALGSSDGRVREVGLVYLVTVQKQFIVDLEITPESVDNISNPIDKQYFLEINPLTIVFNSLDKNTLTLDGRATPGLGNFVGTINQAGLTLVADLYSYHCQLQFRGVAGGALRGALSCGAMSFPASTPLP